MRKAILSILFLAILLLVPTMVFATETASLPDAVNGIITLTEDIVLEDMVVIDAAVTLDLNGHKISNTTDIWNTATASYALISVGKGGNLTITGEGALQAKENDCFAAMVQDGGKLTINSGKYVGNIHSIYIIDEGEVVINGGEYSIQQLSPEVETDKYRYTLNCRDEYYVAGKAKFTVTGGKFYNFNPENNLSEGKETNYLVEGHRVVKNGDWYTVYKENTITVQKNEGGTVSVTLTKAIVGEKVGLTIKQDDGYEKVNVTVIDSNGNTVEVTNNEFIMPDCGVTVKAEFAKIKAEVEIVTPEDKTENNNIGIIESEKVQETLDTALKADEKLNQKVETATNNGEKVTVQVKVDELEKNEVKEEEKQQILQTVKENQKVHQYFDISILVATEKEELGKITQLKEKMKFAMEISKDLIKEGRVFYILKLHDDKVERIEGKLNGTKVEFELDQFSLFALAYEDDSEDVIGKTEEKVPVEGEKDETPKTGIINIPGYVWVSIAAMAVVGIKTTKKQRSKHSKK